MADGAVRLTSGGNLREALVSRRPVELEPGKYRGGKLLNLGEVKIVGLGEGVIIEGGLKLEKCGRVRLFDVGFSQSEGPGGLFIVRCAGLECQRVACWGNQGAGILTANTSHVVIDACSCWGNNGHGIYLSQSGDNLEIRDSICRENGKCGIQVNAVQRPVKSRAKDDGKSVGVRLLRNWLEGNQREWKGSAINLAGVRKGTVEGNNIVAHYGEYGISLWDDGTGKKQFACHEVVIRGNIYSYAEGKGTDHNVSSNCTEIEIYD